jgi:eukaryotic translation initiation factor 2-alpha kinase 4
MFSTLAESGSEEEEEEEESSDSTLRRDNELLSLEAMYGDDFSLQRRGRQPKIAIEVKCPDADTDDRSSSCTLVIEYPCGYPEHLSPKVTFEGLEGPSNKHKRDDLRRRLATMAEERAGEEVTFDLVLVVSEFLSEDASGGADLLTEMATRMQERAAEEEAERNERSRTQREEEAAALADAESAELLLGKELDQQIADEKSRRAEVAQEQRRVRSASLDAAAEEPPPPPEEAGEGVDEEGEDDEEEADILALARADGSRFNRWQADFKAICILGKGGGGEVVSCRNRLDNLQYAVKKILLDPTNKSENQKIIREIKTLSRLSHQGIVRYYHAWVESEGDSAMWPGDGTLEGTLSEMENSLHQDISSSSSEESGRGRGLGWDLAPSAAAKGRGRAFSGSDSDDGGLVFRGADAARGVEGSDDGSDAEEGWEELGSCSDASSIDLSDPLAHAADNQVQAHHQSGSTSSIKPKLSCFLYIQMEYCDTTLRALIDRGSLHTNLDEVWRILRQIVDALAYIHESGVIHRCVSSQRNPVQTILARSLGIGESHTHLRTLVNITSIRTTSAQRLETCQYFHRLSR